MEPTQIIVILILSLLAATISGVAGFGGGLILLPLLTYFVPLNVAVPLLTVAQLFGNGSRVYFSYKELRWRPVILFLLGAIPFAVLGSRLMVNIDSSLLKICIGIFLVLVVIYKRCNKKDFGLNRYWLIPGGAITGFVSGLIGSAGPVGAVFFLGLKLPPLSYISSEAFTALSMHLTKIFVYGKYELLNIDTFVTGTLAGFAMVGGSYLGKRIITKISTKRVDFIIEILLLVSSVQLIIF
ncbi:sulfite exporter TauE/SafE family protein [Arenibacter algicola]|uniref:sulfite exporter TauE/SafE family protein n=1 Tax=Arenibacter algicola TaxID=616991 RepID=UPI001C072B55|nr:sulfite exporter TauE/SafE family protein [Arenibacter algicola]MBU2907523.1 sulfite exporter TauE/SafE family protein [Arenibacter algicola]